MPHELRHGFQILIFAILTLAFLQFLKAFYYSIRAKRDLRKMARQARMPQEMFEQHYQSSFQKKHEP